MAEEINSEQRPDDGQLRNKKPGETLIGKTLFDRYEVLEVLGESAMALVLKAREVNSQRLVAIKTVTPHDPEIVKRFAQEVQLHGLLNHPNIVEAIDCLETQGGRAFFIMEFLYGASLRHILQSQTRIDNEEDLGSIILQVCDALEHAHAAGVLHRDLKPGNIFLLEKDNKLNVKVLDFGIAKPLGQQTGLTQAGYAVGSPLYMSPEQCRGQKVDARSDVYSMGILAYEMTTGNLPYAGHNIMTVMAAHCDPERKPTALSSVVPDLKRVDELNEAIQISMETDPAKRFQTIAEFRKAIQRWHEGVQADMLSTLVAGQQLNLPAETKHAVAEKALQMQSGVNIPKIPSDESVMAPPPALVPAPERETGMERVNRSAMHAPENSRVERTENAEKTERAESARRAETTDRPERLEKVSLTVDDQKGRIRTRLYFEPPIDTNVQNRNKTIVIVVVVVMIILLIALLAMGKMLLH